MEINVKITREVCEASQTNRSSESQENSSLKKAVICINITKILNLRKVKVKVHLCTGTETLYR